MSCHSSLRATPSSFKVCGWCWWLWRWCWRWSHSCSMGLQSGKRGGHSNYAIPLRCKAKFIILAQWGRALSSTKIKSGSNFLANGMIMGWITKSWYHCAIIAQRIRKTQYVTLMKFHPIPLKSHFQKLWVMFVIPHASFTPRWNTTDRMI